MSSPVPLTWLQAAEHVLREEGPEMHIKDLTTRILELGIVKSNCATSLETLLYRQTSGGSQAKGNSRGIVGPSKFTRVSGKHGWFGLKPHVLQEESDLNISNISLESIEDIFQDEKENSDLDMEVELNQQWKKNSISSDEEEAFFLMSSDSDDSSYQLDDSGEGSSDSDEDSSLDENMYRKKYSFLKKIARSVIYENAALADQLTLMERKIRRIQVERQFLFKKLIQFKQTGARKRCAAGVMPFSGFLLRNQAPTTQGDDTKAPPRPHPHQQQQQQQGVVTEEPSARKLASRQPPQLISQVKKPKLSVAHIEVKKNPQHVEKQRGNLLLDNSEQSSGGELEWSDSDEGDLVMDTPSAAVAQANLKKKVPRKTKKAVVKSEDPVCGGDDGEDEELELAMRSGKVRRLHPIPLNSDGSPIFPIVVGGLRVHNLGKIVWDRMAYHSERYLLPVGFESCRTYPSMIDPSKKCSYTCKILDGGEAPIFEMVADNDPDNPVRASSSTACQTIVLKNINKARDKQATNSGSGPEFFGYSNPTVLNLLQKMADARKCPKYKFVRFAEPSNRRGGQKNPSGGVRKQNTKLKTQLKGKKGTLIVPAKKVDVYETGAASKGSRQLPHPGDPGLAIAPVGTGLEGQYGNLNVSALSNSSSSDESSSATDNELIIDS